jgi:5-methylcytosine-specific restriction endonuclease McrA
VCAAEKARFWYLANTERAKQRIYKRAADNKEAIRAYNTKYAREKYYPNNRAKVARKNRLWQLRNPEKVRENNRARAAKAPPLPAEKLRARFSVFGDRCAYCRAVGPLHADHVIPLSRGGPHIVANIRPACRTCNCSKNAKPLKEWLATREHRETQYL